MYHTETFTLTIRGRVTELARPVVMGILNVTPDSFYAASRVQSERQIVDRAAQIASEGGAIIDVGACSTRPGSTPVGEDEEMARLRFALRLIRREQPDTTLSVDTFRPSAAKMCIEEFGASIINDVSEGSDDMFRLAGTSKATYILMSQQPTIERTADLFALKIRQLRDCGCRSIILDPGYGFGKTIEQNYAVLRRQEELLDFGLPLLAGVSRKRMVWQLLGSSPDDALAGATALHALCLERGAKILRVHDVRAAVETIKILEACSSVSA